MRERVCVYVCVREKERVCMCVRESVCVYVRERSLVVLGPGQDWNEQHRCRQPGAGLRIYHARFWVWGLRFRGEGCGCGVEPLDEARQPALPIEQAVLVQKHLKIRFHRSGVGVLGFIARGQLT